MESIQFRIMNLKGLWNLEKEIEQLEDVKEREIRQQFLEQIQEIITDYDSHVWRYAYKQVIRSLLDRGVILEAVEKTPIIAEWDEQFDSLVSAEKKKETPDYSDQFKWHLFSFELLPALKEDAAREAFDSAEKTELYLFFDYSENAYRIKNANLLKAEDMERLSEFTIMDYADMYFFDPVKKWTYVRTHEHYLGPYYFKAE